MNELKEQLKQLIKNEIKTYLMEVSGEEYSNLGTKSQRTQVRTLRVFDFDDTIAKTSSKVGVTEFDSNSNVQLKDKYLITPGEYAVFDKDPAKRYEFDYGDFANVVDPRLIDQTFSILKSVVKKMREDQGIPAVILTARGHDANKNIREFLASLDITIPVKTLDGSAPELKSNWIKKIMLDRDIPHVEFFDDSVKNIRAVDSLKEDPELQNKFGNLLKIRARLVIVDK